MACCPCLLLASLRTRQRYESRSETLGSDSTFQVMCTVRVCVY